MHPISFNLYLIFIHELYIFLLLCADFSDHAQKIQRMYNETEGGWKILLHSIETESETQNAIFSLYSAVVPQQIHHIYITDDTLPPLPSS